jgi:hypothetical protein
MSGSWRGRRELGRRGASRLTVAVVLGLTVVAVGVVGYVVLNATVPAGSSGTSVHACTPANSPGCKGQGVETAVHPARGGALGIAG